MSGTSFPIAQNLLLLANLINRSLLLLIVAILPQVFIIFLES